MNSKINTYDINTEINTEKNNKKNTEIKIGLNTEKQIEFNKIREKW